MTMLNGGKNNNKNTATIRLPHFKITKSGKVLFLDQYQYLKFGKLNPKDSFLNKIFNDEGIIIYSKKINKAPTIKPQKILVLEPHPDDFALSASSYVIKKITEGSNVTILNFFSKTSIEKFPWKDKIKITERLYEKLRLIESKIAIEKYLGERFESYRLPSATLRKNDATFLDYHQENDLVDTLTERVVAKIKKENFNTLLCPAAIQGHIDHLITFDVAKKTFNVLGNKIELIFYEDMPYALNKTAYFERLELIKKLFDITPFFVSTENFLNIIADMIICYRSQFDDVNRSQMFALVKQNFRATATEWHNQDYEFAQRFYKVINLR